MFQADRLFLGLLKVFFFLAYIVGIFPFKYKPKLKQIKHSIISTCLGCFFTLLGCLYPLASSVILRTMGQAFELNYRILIHVMSLYITGSGILLGCIYIKDYKKIVICCNSLVASFITVCREYRRNQFEFDALFILTFFAKILMIRLEIITVSLDIFEIGDITLESAFKFSYLISSAIYFFLTVGYLFVGAIFDNMLMGLERNYSRICSDKQKEGREIYLEETVELYLEIRACCDQLQQCLSPLWVLSSVYVAFSIVCNYWQLYFDIASGNEEEVARVVGVSFLIMVFAASMVPLKARRLERYLGVFCLEKPNSQQEALEGIDLWKTLFTEMTVKVFHTIRLHPFFSILWCIIFLKKVELYTALSYELADSSGSSDY